MSFIDAINPYSSNFLHIAENLTPWCQAMRIVVVALAALAMQVIGCFSIFSSLINTLKPLILTRSDIPSKVDRVSREELNPAVKGKGSVLNEKVKNVYLPTIVEELNQFWELGKDKDVSFSICSSITFSLQLSWANLVKEIGSIPPLDCAMLINLYYNILYGVQLRMEDDPPSKEDEFNKILAKKITKLLADIQGKSTFYKLYLYPSLEKKVKLREYLHDMLNQFMKTPDVMKKLDEKFPQIYSLAKLIEDREVMEKIWNFVFKKIIEHEDWIYLGENFPFSGPSYHDSYGKFIRKFGSDCKKIDLSHPIKPLIRNIKYKSHYGYFLAFLALHCPNVEYLKPHNNMADNYQDEVGITKPVAMSNYLLLFDKLKTLDVTNCLCKYSPIFNFSAFPVPITFKV